MSDPYGKHIVQYRITPEELSNIVACYEAILNNAVGSEVGSTSVKSQHKEPSLVASVPSYPKDGLGKRMLSQENPA